MYKFVLNASPIATGNDPARENNPARAVLVALDDITELEQRNIDLEITTTKLEENKSKVHYIATRDPLTGCLNRGSYGEQFKVAFDLAQKYGNELCCIMADLDHLKSVNDNHGQAVGDVVIKLLPEILQSNYRQDDLIGRYGGDEFCVVLPNQTLEAALKVAKRIRMSFKDESIKSFEGAHM